jgi:hypothetical protein
VSERRPAGWPRDLPPAGTAEFEAKVVGWLLDRGPADLRVSPLRHHPVALARVVARLVESSLEGMRGSYASARVELGEYLSPDQLTVVQAALEAEGARLLQIQREVALVEDVLRRTGSVRGSS